MALSHKKLLKKRQKKQKKKIKKKHSVIRVNSLPADYSYPEPEYLSPEERHAIDEGSMIVLHDGDTVRLGDHIVINQSYIDPDTKEDLQGYCGRIVEFKPELRRITVEWDAETQQRFPERTRQWCEDYAEDSVLSQINGYLI